MRQTSKQSPFALLQIVATPGALTALEKEDKHRVSSSRAMSTASAAICPRTTAKKTSTA
jgi:hypothetical protein